jgi:trehalose 6-phosphate phosphatase
MMQALPLSPGIGPDDLDPSDIALLLDLDGTLVDIAATPELVVVPPALVGTLRRLRPRLGDALAVVTGREIAQIDTLLGDLPFAVAAEHGAVLRRAPAAAVERAALPAVPPAWRLEAARLAASIRGVRLEEKKSGFVLHYRAAPAAGPALEAALRGLVEDPAFVIGQAHMAWEIRPRGVSKGDAVRRLMEHGPFAGRAPVFVGDDVTDLDGIAAARAFGGAGFFVGEDFVDAAGVRAWLGRLAA